MDTDPMDMPTTEPVQFDTWPFLAVGIRHSKTAKARTQVTASGGITVPTDTEIDSNQILKIVQDALSKSDKHQNVTFDRFFVFRPDSELTTRAE